MNGDESAISVQSLPALTLCHVHQTNRLANENMLYACCSCHALGTLRRHHLCATMAIFLFSCLSPYTVTPTDMRSSQILTPCFTIALLSDCLIMNHPQRWIERCCSTAFLWCHGTCILHPISSLNCFSAIISSINSHAPQPCPSVKLSLRLPCFSDTVEGMLPREDMFTK